MAIRRLLVRMIPTNSTPEFEARAKEKAEKAAWDDQAYYRYHDRTRSDYECRGVVARYDGIVDPPAYARSVTDAFYPSGALGDWEPTHFTAWGKMQANACGLGTLGGNRNCVNIIFGDSVCGIGSFDHENGHNRGMHHSGILEEDGNEKEYGNDRCIMGGGGATQKPICSPHMVQTGMDTPYEVIVVDELNSPIQLLLCPKELSYHCLHENEYQHIILRKAGHDDIFLSTNSVKGYRFPDKANKEGRLFAQKVAKDGRDKRIEPDMMPGAASWKLPNYMVVDYHEYKNGTSRISIRYRETDPMPDDIPMPVGLPKSLPSATLLPKHSNLWYDPLFSGQGFDLYVKENGQAGMYWYTANEFDDTLKWYLILKNPGEDHFTIYDHDGGTWETPACTEHVVGTGKVEFWADNRGVFVYDMPEIYGRGSVELQPVIPPNQNPLSGTYYQLSESGSGFTIRFFDFQGVKRISTYWYAWDHDGNKLWFTGEGAYDQEKDKYIIILYEVVGLNWMYPTQTQTNKVGSATLTVEANGVFTYLYNITDSRTGVKESGSLTLTRLL